MFKDMPRCPVCCAYIWDEDIDYVGDGPWRKRQINDPKTRFNLPTDFLDQKEVIKHHKMMIGTYMRVAWRYW